MFSASKIQFFLLLSNLFMCLNTANAELYEKRNRKSEPRTLTFPPTAPTRVQFIGGIGIPVEDLFFEAVTSGYVLKAEYFLPTLAEEFTTHYLRPQTIQRRSTLQMMNETLTRSKAAGLAHDGSSSFGSNYKSKQNNASTYRWVVYKAIELALNSSGLPGRACILRSICEHAATPLHYRSGILGELLHIILTPSSSYDKFSSNFDHSYSYLRAEMSGRKGKHCESIFSNCSKTPIDLITAVFDLDNVME